MMMMMMNTGSVDIGMEYGIDIMCHANNEKQKTTNDGRNRTLGEKETWKYWNRR